MDERGAAARPAVISGAVQRFITRQHIRAVALFDVQVRESAHELRNAAAGGLHFDRHRDGIAVVFDQV